MNNNNIYGYLSTSIGLIEIVVHEDQIVVLNFTKEQKYEDNNNNYLITIAKKQLSDYFSGKRQNLNLPIAINGTLFQVLVWSKVYQISYGKTWTYKQLAAIINSPKAASAVARAVARNKLAIIIPCHRVRAANNRASTKHKVFLQQLEQRNLR